MEVLLRPPLATAQPGRTARPAGRGARRATSHTNHQNPAPPHFHDHRPLTADCALVPLQEYASGAQPSPHWRFACLFFLTTISFLSEWLVLPLGGPPGPPGVVRVSQIAVLLLRHHDHYIFSCAVSPHSSRPPTPASHHPHRPPQSPPPISFSAGPRLEEEEIIARS